MIRSHYYNCLGTYLQFVFTSLYTLKLIPILRSFLVRKRTIPTERPPLVGEVVAKLCG
jgi:hypothetical protein